VQRKQETEIYRDIENSNLLVTGATGGVGPAVTDRLTDRGAEVAGTYRDEDELEEAKRRGENSSDVNYYEVELTDQRQVEQLRQILEKNHGGLDGLVNLVGGYSPGTLNQTDADQFRNGLETHATTVFLTLKTFNEHLEQNNGAAVNFSSQTALNSDTGAIAYNAGKMAVASITSCADAECQNARINAVAPATIDTPANREAMPDVDRNQWTSLDEVANVVEYLVSNRSRPITGQIIPI